MGFQELVKQTTYDRVVVTKYGGSEVLKTTEEAIKIVLVTEDY